MRRRRRAGYALATRSSPFSCLCLIRRKAIEQARTAGGLQQVLAAAARAVRRVPGAHVPGGLLQPDAVVVADNGRAFGALGPVAAGGVAARRRVAAVGVGAGENIVHVGLLP